MMVDEFDEIVSRIEFEQGEVFRVWRDDETAEAPFEDVYQAETQLRAALQDPTGDYRKAWAELVLGLSPLLRLYVAERAYRHISLNAFWSHPTPGTMLLSRLTSFLTFVQHQKVKDLGV